MGIAALERDEAARTCVRRLICSVHHTMAGLLPLGQHIRNLPYASSDFCWCLASELPSPFTSWCRFYFTLGGDELARRWVEGEFGAVYLSRPYTYGFAALVTRRLLARAAATVRAAPVFAVLADAGTTRGRTHLSFFCRIVHPDLRVEEILVDLSLVGKGESTGLGYATRIEKVLEVCIEHWEPFGKHFCITSPFRKLLLSTILLTASLSLSLSPPSFP